MEAVFSKKMERQGGGVGGELEGEWWDPGSHMGTIGILCETLA